MTNTPLTRINNVGSLLPHIDQITINGEAMGKIETLKTFKTNVFTLKTLEVFSSQEDES